MYVTAVARPHPDMNFDGKIGIWEVTQMHVAKRSTNNCTKGDVVREPATLNKQRWLSLLRQRIAPAIRQRMPWLTKVFIQVDNAAPHGAVESGTETKLPQHTTEVVVQQQPEQSPDINVNDLTIYSALQNHTTTVKMVS
jgi:hypothetical protein